MRMYDIHRGLMTALGAGTAGLLVWIATQVGQQSPGRFWAAMGLIAAAGLVMAFSQLLGGWTKWGWPRLSSGVFLLGFLPVLVCVGWMLMATQPGQGWHEGTVAGWSRDIGLFGLIQALALYHGVLGFGFGLALGFSFDTTGPRRREDVALDHRHETMVMDRPVADEPLAAERAEVASTHDAPVEPAAREDVPARMD